MPTKSRLSRSVLAIAVVVSLLSGAPTVVLAASRPGDDGASAPTLLRPAVAQARVTTVSAAPTAQPRVTTSTSSSYRGRNHVWIPSLGIDRSVSGYSCASSYYPSNRVYRWGCGGRNNLYLFGHAHSVFKPLHDAYVRGRLRKGMKVIYADSGGRLGTYSVVWWKVTTPTNGYWAYAPLAKPGMTLQTCVGANSRYRLIVRLYKVG